jgi:hypothetical protein
MTRAGLPGQRERDETADRGFVIIVRETGMGVGQSLQN